MPANVDAMVRAGAEAFRAGKKAEARTLLERAIELDGYNESAWLWLSAVVESPEEQQTCLENVLTINPNNERAKQGLKSLGITPSSKPAATSSAPAFEMGTFDFDESEDIFPNPAPASSSTPPKAAAKPVQDDIFGDVDFSASPDSYAIDDSLFGDDPYGATAEEEYIDDGLFDTGDDMYADINTMDDFESQIDSSADYDDSIFDDDPLAPPPPKAAPAASRSSSPAPVADISGGSIGSSMLRQIPAEIPLGRMPGTNEAAPTIHYFILGFLALVNIGALFFVVLQFIG